MDEWDEEKLGEVVKKKHGSEKANATDIVRLFWRYLFHRLNLSISLIHLLEKNSLILDLQTLLGCCRKWEIWLVLVMSEWRG